MKTIDTTPSIIGTKAKAWRMDLDEVRKGFPKKDIANDRTVGTWLIEAPWAHPFWHSYVLILIHLRPTNPPSPTKIYLDGATRRKERSRLHPDTDREKYLKDGKSQLLDGRMCMPLLLPINLARLHLAYPAARGSLWHP